MGKENCAKGDNSFSIKAFLSKKRFVVSTVSKVISCGEWIKPNTLSRTKSRTAFMVVAIALALCVFSHAASAAQISVVPSFQTVSTGENFSVNISVDPEGSEVFGAQYELHFNNTLLNAISQTQGPFLSQDGASTSVVKYDINNTLGWVKYGEMRIGTGVGGVTNPSVLATVTFQAIAEEDGVSELNFTVVKLSDPGINPIATEVKNGTVSVRMGICGDVNNDKAINMADMMTLWYDYADYPTPGAYEVNCCNF